MKIWLALLIIGTSGILLELKRNQFIQTTNIEMDSYMGLSDFYIKELKTSFIETEQENVDFAINESNPPGNTETIENCQHTDVYTFGNDRDTYDHSYNDYNENEINGLVNDSYVAVGWTVRGNITWANYFNVKCSDFYQNWLY